MEGLRYIALNWSSKQCRMSKLRKVLPVRRSKKGPRPGVRGSGPMGATCGDQDQWVFVENLVLSEEDQREIVATVVQIATAVLFSTHVYSFGGKYYQQRDGGPIGLRGTCAIARLVMVLWDQRWGGTMRTLRVETELNCRYMDDGRSFLHPIKHGWRYSEGKLRFCKQWEWEDKDLSGTEVTRRVLAGTMGEVLPFLRFTTEVPEDFEGGWLPTLDTQIMVTEDNIVRYKYYQKPTTSQVTVQRRSAMAEVPKNQVLSNDFRRRLMNTEEGCSTMVLGTITDCHCCTILYSRVLIWRQVLPAEGWGPHRTTRDLCYCSSGDGTMGPEMGRYHEDPEGGD